MRVLDLFAGIGGFSLGLERAGMQTIAFCEIDPFCQKVLRRHWPDVKQLGDVHGFPLSRFISRGEEEGAGRGPEQSGIKPTWIIAENVHHTWRRWVPELRLALHERGYSSLPIQVSANELGASHARKRVYIIAHADGERVRQFSWWWQWEAGKVAAELGVHWDKEPKLSRVDDGVSDRVDRCKCVGNAVVPQIPEIIGRAIMKIEAGEKVHQ